MINKRCVSRFCTVRTALSATKAASVSSTSPPLPHARYADCCVVSQDPCHLVSPAVSYTHLRAHETPEHLVCRLLLEKKKNNAHNCRTTSSLDLNYNIKSTMTHYATIL
eukprot:TRINITY_DN26311_c0_g1_i1.p1 TRINITY_DN26311_c0_g1~~TRINITY_DN26311_c0_g1_i1.p1  ORF type:complete len:109 (-),score=5.28 TRINITY_DN26311_c0_g1_i1:5-331(-)